MLVLRDWRVLLALALGLLVLGHFDRSIAQRLFYSADTGWLGAGAGDWWADKWIHDGGRWIPRVLVAATIAAWLASWRVVWLASWRRELAYAALGMTVVIVLVGTLKQLTNVDCPWDLAGFGGDRPYVGLFGNRPGWLPHAACFPGAHSSSGFALCAFYFALRDRAPRAALAALVAAILVGVSFAVGQEARGAHFLSHDLAAAAIAWLVLAALYPVMLKR